MEKGLKWYENEDKIKQFLKGILFIFSLENLELQRKIFSNKAFFNTLVMFTKPIQVVKLKGVIYEDNQYYFIVETIEGEEKRLCTEKYYPFKGGTKSFDDFYYEILQSFNDQRQQNSIPTIS